MRTLQSWRNNCEIKKFFGNGRVSFYWIHMSFHQVKNENMNYRFRIIGSVNVAYRVQKRMAIFNSMNRWKLHKKKATDTRGCLLCFMICESSCCNLENNSCIIKFDNFQLKLVSVQKVSICKRYMCCFHSIKNQCSFTV